MYVILLVTLLDGSAINLQVHKDHKFRFESEYGVWNLPVSHIREINVGCHVDDPAKIAQVAANLGTEKYKDRAEADAYLKAWYKQAYPTLLKLAQDQNPEVANRAAGVISRGGAHRLLDSIVCGNNSVEGMIADKYLAGVSVLGELKIPFSQIVSINVRMDKRSLVMRPGVWVNVGYAVDRITITASGSIDLWPQNLGSYVSSPDGIVAQTNGYPSGSLIGKLNGRTFLVGSNFTSTGMRGKLELSVNPAPDNWVPHTEPIGSYNVEVE